MNPLNSSVVVSLAGISPLFVVLASMLGALLPNLVAVFQQPKWPNPLRVLVTILVCLASGVIYAGAQHKLDSVSVSAAVVIVLFTAWQTYLAVWKPSGIAPAIENATTDLFQSVMARLNAPKADAAAPVAALSTPVDMKSLAALVADELQARIASGGATAASTAGTEPAAPAGDDPATVGQAA